MVIHDNHNLHNFIESNYNIRCKFIIMTLLLFSGYRNVINNVMTPCYITLSAETS